MTRCPLADWAKRVGAVSVDDDLENETRRGLRGGSHDARSGFRRMMAAGPRLEPHQTFLLALSETEVPTVGETGCAPICQGNRVVSRSIVTQPDSNVLMIQKAATPVLSNTVHRA